MSQSKHWELTTQDLVERFLVLNVFKIHPTAKGSSCPGPSVTAFPQRFQERPMLPVLEPKFETQSQHRWTHCTQHMEHKTLLLKWGLQKRRWQLKLAILAPGVSWWEELMDRDCNMALCRLLGCNEEVGEGGRQGWQSAWEQMSGLFASSVWGTGKGRDGALNRNLS